MRETTELKLRTIFRAVLRLPADADVSRARQGSEPTWDSLATALLASAIASEFHVEIDTNDTLALTSYEAAAALLEERDL